MFVSTCRARIAELRLEGQSVGSIAAQLKLARNTVTYHLARLEQPSEATIAPPPPPGDAVRHVRTRETVSQLLDAGIARADIARHLNLSKSTVSYHARRIGKPIDARCARRYDWTAIQAFYDAGATVREAAAAFGFSLRTWHAAVKRGVIVARPASMPLSELLVAGKYRGRAHLKRRILAAGIKRSACEECGIADWLGRPIGLALHHINGDRVDNRVENLELLCPNCHSQTNNFSGRKRAAVST